MGTDASMPKSRSNEAPAPAPTQRSLSGYLDSQPRRGTTTEAVVAALREAILDGAIPGSTRLREEDLARQLSVSRTPVREALGRLADERLVVREANRGAVVAPMTLEEILAVYAVRESLEGVAARAVALRDPQTTTTMLLEVHTRMQGVLRNPSSAGLEKLIHQNLEFHRIMRRQTGNPYLERILTQVEHAVRRFGRSTYQTPGRAQEAMAEHQAIIDAIGAGDPGGAQAAASLHMQKARDARIRATVG